MIWQRGWGTIGICTTLAIMQGVLICTMVSLCVDFQEVSNPHHPIELTLVHRKVRHGFGILTTQFWHLLALSAENKFDEELKGPVPFESHPSETTVPPDIQDSVDGTKYSFGSDMLQLCWTKRHTSVPSYPRRDPCAFWSRKSRYVPSYLHCPKWAQVGQVNLCSLVQRKVCWGCSGLNTQINLLFICNIYSKIICTSSDLWRRQESPVDTGCINSNDQVGEFGCNWLSLWCPIQWSVKGVHYFNTRLYVNFLINTS